MAKKQRDVREENHIQGGFVLLSHNTVRSSLWKMKGDSVKLAITLILEANYEDKKWFDRWQGKEIIIKRGELITTIQNLSVKANLSIKTTRTSLRNITRSRFCENITATAAKRAKGYTHLRLPKYEKYQDFTNYVGAFLAKDRQTIGQSTGNRRAIDGHILKEDKTSKQVKQEKEEGNSQSSQKDRIQDVVNLWNILCMNLPKIQSIGTQRESNILNRLKEHPDMKDWQQVFSWLNESPHHRGQNKRKWVATIDFIIERGKGAKFNEILEKAQFTPDNSLPDAPPQFNEFGEELDEYNQPPSPEMEELLNPDTYRSAPKGWKLGDPYPEAKPKDSKKVNEAQ